jgi:hypothetical protein
MTLLLRFRLEEEGWIPRVYEGAEARGAQPSPKSRGRLFLFGTKVKRLTDLLREVHLMPSTCRDVL